ncbi:MAG: family 16 glycoside hydrolase [Fermentimonas sp.]
MVRQLRTIATDSSVDILALLLNDDYLLPTAATALASINSDKANEALLNALKNSQSETLIIHVANALGQTGYPKAESTLLELLQRTPAEEMQQVLLNALAQAGTKEAVKAMRAAATKANFSYQKSDATASYLTLLNRLIASEPKLVDKEAKKLFAAAKKRNLQDIKTAATKLQLSLPNAKTEKILQDAIKDGNLTYLNGVLNAFPFQNDKNAIALVEQQFASAKSPELQATLIHWLSNHEVGDIVTLAVPLTTSSDLMVQKAAANALARHGGNDALIALAAMLKSDNDETVAIGKSALLTFKGDIAYTLASLFDASGDEGKKAILELIAARKMEDQYNLVFNQMFTNNATVKAAAANTLKAVATDKNLTDLFTLLEQPGQTEIPALQQAINAALSHLPANQQLEVVTGQIKRSVNKHLYYSALANSGSQEALETIAEAYKQTTGEEKEAAFNALASWKSFHVVYSLLDIARASNDKTELGKVTDALIPIIRNSGETGAIKYLYAREAMQFAQNDQQKNQLIQLMGTTGHYQAMLFVAPFMDQPATSETAAQAAMNIAIANPSFAGEETTAILNKVSKTLANPDADYQRQSIAKYLSENPSEGGFVSMFNGKNLDGWKGLVENPIQRPKMSERKLAAAQKKADEEAARDWRVEDGCIVFYGTGGNNLCTEKQYGDFEMLVDWKLFPGPEPDAGIYLRGTPQVQIWDTARVHVGAQVGSGGLYNNKQHPSKPLKVADQKVGEWNTFRIRMIGDRVSVWLNGELVTDNVILENFWDRSQPIFPVEQIELQAHGSKAAYRDIYIKEIERVQPFTLSEEEEKEGFKVLFDGTHMHHWIGNTTDYFIEDGVMVVDPQGRNTSGTRNLYTKEQYDNFVFRFEFMLTPAANNGLGIRTSMEGDAAYIGMELQILDNEAPVYEKLQPYQYHGSVYGVIPAKRGYLKPVGEWNYQEVIANGDRITVILNGTTILDGDIREASKNGTMDKREHPGLLNESGHIGFLGHGSKLKFRNIRVKKL